MDWFGFKKRRERRHKKFMEMLSYQDDEYLLNAYEALDMNMTLGMRNEYTIKEKIAVEEELDKRGYVDDYGFVHERKIK